MANTAKVKENWIRKNRRDMKPPAVGVNILRLSYTNNIQCHSPTREINRTETTQTRVVARIMRIETIKTENPLDTSQLSDLVYISGEKTYMNAIVGRTSSVAKITRKT